jgi:DNA sulfur modification protein DndD
VLGIKKYEELKNNLESLLTKLRRRGVSDLEEYKLKELLSEEEELEKLINHNQDKQDKIDKHLVILKSESDALQEKLIREGNSITLEELKELKSKRDDLKNESISIKQELRKLLDFTPLVMAGKHLSKLYNQLVLENDELYGALTEKLLKKELESFSTSILANKDLLSLDSSIKNKIEKVISNSLKTKFKKKDSKSKVGKVYLEFSEESFREFEAIYNNIKTTFLGQFNAIVKKEKINRAILSRTNNKIKQGEVRKNNHLAKQFRNEKSNADANIENLLNEKNDLLEEVGGLRLKLTSHKKVRSEYEKNFNLVETDKKKYDVTQKLLFKISELIKRIKEDKKYSLQKSVSLGLKNLMHKKDFISNVSVNIIDDVMDIDLLDKKGQVIDKDSLSKGEQQLYATALLKALVDESGIKFPVFIDSPLQKFDKYHSKNIIKEFYPSISEQVVLFPLLEKELSEAEYELLKPNLNKAFLIHNTENGSEIISTRVNNLFKEFKKEKDVYTY